MIDKEIKNNQKNPFIYQKNNKECQSKNNERLYSVSVCHNNNNINNKSYYPNQYYNDISTSKYRWYFCLPLILFEQFSKLTNIYFLLVSIMQMFKEISNANGHPITLMPLTFVIFFNGIKDFYEDWKRKKCDDEENNKKVEIYDGIEKKFISKKWKNVHLGNVIKVYENEYFPGDCVLLKTSEKNSMCYVETKNLDGETNLKLKKANPHFDSIIKQEDDILNFKGVIQCNQPNEFIYEFDGIFSFEINNNKTANDQRNYQQIKENNNNTKQIIIPSFESSPHDKISIDKDSFLLRGSSLIKIKYIYGLVVYAGHSTKIMKNSTNAKAKTSKVENIMNNQIIYIFIFQILLSCLGAGFSLWVINQSESSIVIPYISKDIKFDYMYFLTTLGTWIMLLNNLVPISLLFTMEMVKYVQGMFIGWDIEVYDKQLQTTSKVQTSTLNEELGQVKYILSDKTGTLTKNHMQFKKMAIGNYKYGELNMENNNELTDSYGQITNFALFDESIKEQLSNKKNDNYYNIDLYMKCLALCHNVLIDQYNNIDDSNLDHNHKIINYTSPSPDDLSLVNCARYFKYIFAERDAYDNITLIIGEKGKKVKFNLIAEFHYTPERKRMSVIVRDQAKDKCYLFIKGADSVILPKITSNSSLVSNTKQNLIDYAKTGLRTLVIAYKEISDDQLSYINDQLNKAKADIINKDKLIDNLANKIENELYLLGIAGVEDQIQDRVDEAIESFIEAGIKVWVLTGDKKETAKSIATSTKLINDSFYLFEIEDDTPVDSIKKKLADFINDYNSSINRNQSISNSTSSNNKYALIICSNVLSHIFNDKDLMKNFHSLAVQCASVICCRITPKQKAEIVNMIKKYEPQSTILAIGDGANDVNMIAEANIGIGILGVEGRQAARASDYSIGQFYYLKRLLFVHGRESYRKNTFTVCYNFSKNYLFVIPQFILGFDSLFSGQTIYDPIIYQMYNILYAQLPIIWYGIYDKQVSYDTLMQNPKYYTQGIKNSLFGFCRFWAFIFSGIFQAIVLYIFCFKLICMPINYDGYLIDLSVSGSLTYTLVILIVNLQVVMESYSQSMISIALIIYSFLLYLISVYVISLFPLYYIFANFMALFININTYIRIGCILSISFAIDLGMDNLFKYCKIYQDPLDLNLNDKLEEINIEITEISQLTKEHDSPDGSIFNITDADIGKNKNENNKCLIN